jgi:hypothetical protein
MKNEIFNKKGGSIIDSVIHYKKKAILLGIISLLIISCKNPTGPIQEVALEIQGHVSDHKDNSPIFNVSVEILLATTFTTSATLASTLTDNEGFYHLRYVWPKSVDCKESLLTLVFVNKLQPLLYLPKYFRASDTPHVRCMGGLQTIDVKL